MKKYTFKVEKLSTLDLYLNIVADNPAEAVNKVNSGIAEIEEDANDTVYLGLELPPATIVVNPKFQVDESMIVNQEDFSDDDLRRAHEFLTAKGYSYESEPETLLIDDNPSFNKPIFTEDGNYIYALFKVSARFEFNIKRHAFRIEAVLYPVGLASLKDEGTLYYGVHFQDKQAATTIEQLPNALELYEAKFTELIKALRKADPFDGLPLEDDELIG